jgi:uncharacterized DUF497 family protein
VPDYLVIIWDMSGDEGGNVQHIAEHGLSPADVEQVFRSLEEETISESSGRPAVIGWTDAGDLVFVAYDQIDVDTIYPVTAYKI